MTNKFNYTTGASKSMHWAEKAKVLIESEHRTYRQIEQDAGWAKNTLLKAVNNKSDIRVQRAFRLAQALGVPMDWLFDQKSNLPPLNQPDVLHQLAEMKLAPSPHRSSPTPRRIARRSLVDR